MLKCSVKIPGCPNPVEGSMNHFAIYAILKTLQNDFGVSFKYLYPEFYDLNIT
jgi:hypothetical protein